MKIPKKGIASDEQYFGMRPFIINAECLTKSGKDVFVQ